MDEKQAPEIGTTEAAVRSCVSLMAAVMGQREELLAYWCDLYYQVRLAHERETAKPAEEDPTVLRRGDLYPVMRELMRDALRSAKREEAKDRLAQRAKADAEDAEDGPQIAVPEAKTYTSTTTGGTEDVGPQIAAPAITDPMELAKAAEKAMGRRARAMGSQDAAAEAGDPGEAAEEPKLRGWAAKKNLIRNRLLTARLRGATIAQIVTASEGSITEKEIIRILNTEKVATEVYNRLEAALAAIEK